MLFVVSTFVTCRTTDALMKPSMELIMKYTMPTTATLDAVGPSRGLNKTTQHEKLKWVYFHVHIIMGTHRHGQEGALTPLWKCCNMFCALVVTTKYPAEELFMRYFHKLSSSSEGFAPRPQRGSIPGTNWGTFLPRPLICPPLEKILWAPMHIISPPKLPHNNKKYTAWNIWVKQL